MFVPPMYRVDDLDWMRELIDHNPLATLVTAADATILASHVPVIIRSLDEDPVRMTLAGHMNRRNPQWETLTGGAAGLLIFTGPHGYVSPAVYGFTPAAPTWNFTAVHASGPLSAVPPGAPTLDIIKSTVRAFETRFGDRWDMSDSLDYFDQLLPGVGGFVMPVERFVSMGKLSQEQSPEVRRRVADAFAAGAGGRGRELGAMMLQSLGVDTSRRPV